LKKRSQFARGLEDEFVVKLSNSGMAVIIKIARLCVLCMLEAAIIFSWRARCPNAHDLSPKTISDVFLRFLS